jgi:starvation-inducible DNA-binding protein
MPSGSWVTSWPNASRPLVVRRSARPARSSRNDYDLGRADAIAHMGALDLVYAGVVKAHRQAIEETDEPDPVTQDILIGQAIQLEQFHWFVRAHIEDGSGRLATTGTRTEKAAAKKTSARVRNRR